MPSPTKDSPFPETQIRLQIHQQIWDDIQDRLTKNPSAESYYPEIAKWSFEQFCKYVFVNWTWQDPSLKLTGVGFQILKRMYQFHQFNMENTFELTKGKAILFFKNHVMSPWMITPNALYLFGNKDAFEFEMSCRDFSIWMNNFS